MDEYFMAVMPWVIGLVALVVVGILVFEIYSGIVEWKNPSKYTNIYLDVKDAEECGKLGGYWDEGTRYVYNAALKQNMPQHYEECTKKVINSRWEKKREELRFKQQTGQLTEEQIIYYELN